MKKIAFLLAAITFSLTSFAQDSESPLVSFEDYENLMATVKEHRKTRLVDLNQFNQMSTKKEVFILDTRSKEMYDRKHVKGAIHLNFSDFTQANLDALFPHRNAIILIYCNNNFIDDFDMDNIVSDVNFASKGYSPTIDEGSLQLINPVLTQSLQTADGTEFENYSDLEEDVTLVVADNVITLALNIPTYINLYGYGYKNVYELSELVSIHDSRIQFEGTEVTPVEN
ncbi:MAG: rhodanese-like domain-containing protein [Crocinitomicaceae bacterium]